MEEVLKIYFERLKNWTQNLYHMHLLVLKDKSI